MYGLYKALGKRLIVLLLIYCYRNVELLLIAMETHSNKASLVLCLLSYHLKVHDKPKSRSRVSRPKRQVDNVCWLSMQIEQTTKLHICLKVSNNTKLSPRENVSQCQVMK